MLDHAPPIDYPVRVRAEVARNVPLTMHNELISEVARRVQAENNFVCQIELVSPGTIASTEKKTKRVVRAYLEKMR